MEFCKNSFEIWGLCAFWKVSSISGTTSSFSQQNNHSSWNKSPPDNTSDKPLPLTHDSKKDACVRTCDSALQDDSEINVIYQSEERRQPYRTFYKSTPV